MAPLNVRRALGLGKPSANNSWDNEIRALTETVKQLPPKVSSSQAKRIEKIARSVVAQLMSRTQKNAALLNDAWLALEDLGSSLRKKLRPDPKKHDQLNVRSPLWSTYELASAARRELLIQYPLEAAHANANLEFRYALTGWGKSGPEKPLREKAEQLVRTSVALFDDVRKNPSSDRWGTDLLLPQLQEILCQVPAEAKQTVAALKAGVRLLGGEPRAARPADTFK